MRIRKRMCLYCGKEIEYEVARGKDRKYCSLVCQKKANHERTKQRENQLPVCRTVGCGNKANRIGAGLCEACYGRVRRRGTTDRKVAPYKTNQSAGYIRVREPEHTLADSCGTVYEHRYVYHKYHGDGPFDCHWCGKVVTWGDMHVDHVDANRSNNEIYNLVASCPVCNQSRGHGKIRDTMREKHGKLYEYNGETKTLGEWAKEVGITRASMQFRIGTGWPLERAFTEGRGVTGPKNK